MDECSAKCFLIVVFAKLCPCVQHLQPWQDLLRKQVIPKDSNTTFGLQCLCSSHFSFPCKRVIKHVHTFVILNEKSSVHVLYMCAETFMLHPYVHKHTHTVKMNHKCLVMLLELQLLSWWWVTLDQLKIEQGGICKLISMIYYPTACVCAPYPCKTWNRITWSSSKPAEVSSRECMTKHGSFLGHEVIPESPVTVAEESPWNAKKKLVTSVRQIVRCMTFVP